jgi:hypothetical protein
MSLFVAIALTAIFNTLGMSTGWTVACWVVYGVGIILQVILKCIQENL